MWHPVFEKHEAGGPVRQDHDRQSCELGEDSLDNRAAPRKKVVLAGRIVLAGGGTLDCRVRDLSDTGAKLRLGDVSGVPPRFSLEVLSNGSQHRAEIVWARGFDIGVRFI